MLKMNNRWTDGTTGKQVEITEHNESASTIRGIFPDFIIGSMSGPDVRPSVFFYMPQEKFEQTKVNDPAFSFIVLVKTHEGAQAGFLKKMTAVLNLALPHQDAVVKNLADEQQKVYVSERGFRNAMMAGSFVILLITGIGLLGYTANEATRRSKELAIRRISGANFQDILRMFVMDLEYVAVPAVLVGLEAAWFIAEKWMQNFAVKITLNWVIFTVCSLFILLLIALIAAANYTRIANRNPVEALRYE